MISLPSSDLLKQDISDSTRVKVQEEMWGGGHIDAVLGWLQDLWASQMFKASFFLMGDFMSTSRALVCPSWDADTSGHSWSFCSPCQTDSNGVSSPLHMLVLEPPVNVVHIQSIGHSILCPVSQVHRGWSHLPPWILQLGIAATVLCLLAVPDRAGHKALQLLPAELFPLHQGWGWKYMQLVICLLPEKKKKSPSKTLLLIVTL